MDRKSAKELVHIQGWLERVDAEAGEAANRLSRLDVLAPDGVEWPSRLRTATSSSTSTTRSTAN
jgi:hypothetical protein